MRRIAAPFALLCTFAASAMSAGPPASLDPGANAADYRAIEWGVALFDPQDPAEAIARLETSARAGNPHALFLLGASALASEECRRAAGFWQRAHTRGHRVAGAALGHHECKGEPLARAEAGQSEVPSAELERRQRALLERDARYPARFHHEIGTLLARRYSSIYGAATEAVRWLELAAEDGHRNAQVLLGLILSTGSSDPSGGPPLDPERAEHWLRKGASSGDPWALYVLARRLHLEEIPVRDPNEALRRMTELATSAGDPQAAHLAAQILTKRGDHKTAERWFRFAIERKHPRASLSLALLLLDNTTDRKREGIEILHREAARGDDRAQFKLGMMYEFGDHVAVDYKRACRFYRDAAEAGNHYSINNLANCYEVGKGAPRDYAKAHKLYQLAVSKGSAFALYSIGSMHEKGLGVPRSMATAVQYYERAAERGVEEAAAKLETLRGASH